MVKELLARGQATITALSDAYTIVLSPAEYIFPATSSGTIPAAVTISCEVQVTQGNLPVSDFVVGTPAKPAGFASINVDHAAKRITFTVAAGTTTLADHGKIIIPVTVAGTTYSPTFVWSKAKAGTDGASGKPGVDANLLDWVREWDTGKTLIDGSTVITPKLFAGVKNADGTISGVAIGSFPLSTKTPSGTLATETVNGIYGFRNGYKTFYVDSGGNAQLGSGEEYIKYNAATGKVEFGAAVSLQWVGATYIDRNGLFTGTLSADTVRAINIQAAQITSGIISAERIDVAALKASLIAAGNIEALTLNVTKGKIGGWMVDSDSLYRGTKNNTAGAYTSASGSVTLGSNGIRGYKWRLDATGAGAVAGGNIAWDATGNVSFGTGVSVQWTAPIGSLTTALGGSGYPKLTKITAEGIYTGSITASQITAGTISADRIAAGSINASKLDVASVKASLITAGNIEALTLNVTQGKIGGWMIGASALTGTHIALDNGNRRIVVYGANSGATSGQRVQLYYNSDTDFGMFATDNSGSCVARLGSHNQIAGWTIDTAAIRKGNVSLGSDGSIVNGTKWKLNNDGSGQIASGNISWNAAGAVSVSSAVSLLWKSDIEAAKTANFGYRYYKKLVINGDDATYYPVIFKGGEQTVKRDILIRRGYTEQAPDSWHNTTHKGGLILLIKTNFGGWGGIDYSWDIYELSEMYCRMFAGAKLCGNCCMFAVFLRGGGTTGAVYHIYSDQPIESNTYSPAPIPAAPQIAYNSDLIFQSGSTTVNAPAPRTLTAAVEEEIRRHRFIALAQSSDNTLAAHPLTYIGSTGIYTGTLTAAQVNAVAIDAGSIKAGTLSSNRIAAGSIDATKLDAASIKSTIINTDYINGLSCTFTKGKIGGFTIGSDHITVGSVGAIGATPLQIRSKAVGSGYWYTGAYKPMGMTLTWHQSGNAGHIVFGQVAASGNSVKSGFIGIQMMTWDHQEYFCLSANYTKSGGREVYNRIAGWAFDHNHIWKNNISLGSDGSITNTSKWKLNNDGSGRIAAGNISWDAAGNVTFAAGVSVAWSAGIDSLTAALGGASYPKLTQITATGIYTGKISASQINVDTALVVGGSSSNGSISVRDAANNVKATLDRSGITAIGGRIGGWIINSETICAAAPASGHRIYLTSSGYMYNDNPNTGKDYWGLKSDGSATFGYGAISFAADGAGFLAGGNLSWDAKGNLIGKDATLEDIFMTGTFRSPFVAYDGSISWDDELSEAEMHDNLTMPGGGGWILSSDFPWDATQNGRTVTIVNYKYNGQITSGKMSLSAPTGKYFFEDGLLKKEIVLSREYVLLKGYGEGSNFYGWIVMHRGDIGTVSKYGSCAKVMYQGWVENGVIKKQKSFDGGKLTCSKTATGTYRVSFPSGISLPVADYTVMATGANVVAESNAHVYASLTAKTTTSFVIKIADDASLNNGSFTFQVISMADWS